MKNPSFGIKFPRHIYRNRAWNDSGNAPEIITGEKHPCVNLLKNSFGSVARKARFNNPQYPETYMCT